MRNLISAKKTKTTKIMYRIDIFNRDKKGNKGSLITSIHYPTKDDACRAQSSLIHLVKNQYKYKDQWSIKSAIVTSPIVDKKFDK